MTRLNDYFDKILVIASVHRPDRWELMEAQLKRWNIVAERVEGHWMPRGSSGKPSANAGCTSSHRACLELISHFRWPRTLILEDDCLFVDDQWPEMFSEMIKEAPPWRLLFLGASFAEDPKRRVNGSFIETNGLMTTSSYGITYELAREMAPYIAGDSGIDVLYHGWQRQGGCMIFDPRLAVQRAGLSNIQGIVIDPGQSMLDTAHVDRLDRGEAVQPDVPVKPKAAAIPKTIRGTAMADDCI